MNRATETSSTENARRKAGSIREHASPYEAFDRNYPVSIADAAKLFPGYGHSYPALRRRLEEAGAKPAAHRKSNGGQQVALYWPADLAVVMWGEEVARNIVDCSRSTILQTAGARDGA